MTSIRRLSSSILSSLRRTTLDVDPAPVSSLTRSESLQPVTKVRRGFSDESDFQADSADGADALFAGFDTDAADAAEGGDASRELEHAALRVFAGESSFESAAPRYAQRLGAQLPSSLGAPRESSGGVEAASRRGGAGVPDAADILSPDEAAWELQNLDTSSTAVDAPEDLLSMMGAPGASSLGGPRLDLDLDVFEDGPAGIGGVEDRAAAQQWLDASVSPAGPTEFLADLNDLGDFVPEEMGPADAALAGVLGSLAANPVAASVPATAALGAQSVDVVADTLELEPDPRRTSEATLLGQPFVEQAATEPSSDVATVAADSFAEQAVTELPSDVAEIPVRPTSVDPTSTEA